MHERIKWDTPVNFQPSINLEKGLKINDLEQFILATISLIERQERLGKKGVLLGKGTIGECKFSYKKMKKILFALEGCWGMKGCFSFGMCGDCKHFNNSGHIPNYFGTCNGKKVCAFDSCENYNGAGGYGRECNR